VSRPTRAPDVIAGRRPVLEALKAGSAAERILVARGLAPSSLIGEIRKRAERASIPVRVVPRSEVDECAPGLNHQGVVAVAPAYRYAALEKLLAVPAPALLFLDGVMDPQNLGSLLRGADGAGFAGVVIPVRRAASVTAAARRASAGASEVVPVARVTNMGRALDAARSAGLWVVGLDQNADDDLWSSTLMEPPVGLVLGGEDRGIAPGTRSHCDALIAIPTLGRLSSLNVSAAGAVAMFEVARRRRAS
jgi:23S rRNA (guanosine2251-2'-O)-methyltransferase